MKSPSIQIPEGIFATTDEVLVEWPNTTATVVYGFVASLRFVEWDPAAGGDLFYGISMTPNCFQEALSKGYILSDTQVSRAVRHFGANGGCTLDQTYGRFQSLDEILEMVKFRGIHLAKEVDTW